MRKLVETNEPGFFHSGSRCETLGKVLQELHFLVCEMPLPSSYFEAV